MRLSHIERRIEQQLAVMNLIANSYDNAVKVGLSNINPQRIHTRITALKESWQKFDLNHDAITLAIANLTHSDKRLLHSHSYFIDNLYSMTHECYLDTLEKMTCLLESDHSDVAKSSSSIQSVSNPSSVPTFIQHTRLPRIALPKFNGSPADWLPFKDLFSSLVAANPALTSIEKLQYLKTSLIGFAAHLIKHTTLTSENYQKTWDSLVSFYENKRLLVNSALHSLLTLKRMTKESSAELEHLYTNIMQIYRTFETLQRPVDTWDDFLIFIAVQRLDSESVKTWEQNLGSSKEPPSWNQFTDFIITRLLSLQAFEKSRTGKLSSHVPQKAIKTHYQGKTDNKASVSSGSCVLCSSNHYIMTCPQYSQKTVPQRLALIEKHKLCFNCLGRHRSSACRITKRCQKCGRKHHTTIHKVDKPVSKTDTTAKPETESPSSVPSKSEVLTMHSAVKSTGTSSCVFLATAQVKIIAQNGQLLLIRALIDQGSEVSLITERVVQQLRLPRTNSSVSLVGIGAQKSNVTKGVTSFKLTPHFSTNIEYSLSAHILPKLTSLIPSIRLSKLSWPHLIGLNLADPKFCSPGSIDLILGADVYSHIIEESLVKGTEGSPVAQFTKLGWIVSGPTSVSATPNLVHGYHVSLDRDIHELLQRFWEYEEVPISHKFRLSSEEQDCEDHFTATHSRDLSGRYIVRLPFKQSPEKLGESKSKATKLMNKLSIRLSSQSTYSDAYSDFMNEYEKLRHMVKIPTSQSEPQLAYYLPHHGVWRKHSLTTKLRVVFDGSSRTTSGVSLNQLLHTGAKLQIDLFDVLVWFRLFCYVFSSDVEKMYRQIQVHPDDWKYQRILWLDPSNDISTFELTTVTYGLACAPYLALRTFKQLIQDEGKRFPLAISTMKKGRYVDDLFGGADTIEEAQEIVTQLNQLCMAGGFHLQKWISNNPTILSFIPSNKQVSSRSVPIDYDMNVHTFGLCWQPSTDKFHFSLTPPLLKVISKRTILSTIAKLFDPLGLLSPVTITAKIFIQELWSLKIGWDDPLPQLQSDKWTTFVDQLKDMPSFTFPRWLGFKSNYQLELHGFSDSSQQAMAATVYLRSTDSEGDVTTNLIASKTKVAPLKRQTIPRLELSSAILLVRLVSSILKVFDIANIPVYLWTDSSITLIWINNHRSRWKEFVHNRVCFIQETLPQAIWKFIPGKENPADLATRGLIPSQFSASSHWWTGPQWLYQPQALWPTEVSSQLSHNNLEEKIKQVSTLTCVKPVFSLGPSLEIFDSYTADTNHCTVSAIQQSYFKQKIKIISAGQPLSRSNSLVRLTPFIDTAGLLRVGGRLNLSLLPEASKHLLILPRHSALTTLIISDAHSRTLHGGTQVTLSFIRHNYWIIGERAPIRSFILKCVKCTRFRQNRAQQIMGQLPVERLTPFRPFLNSGVDYAGPFSLKTWRGRNARTYKAYIALFVCFATSAVHLELVTDYSTEAFIAAYKRFTARRGICSTLVSDCGTNLKGADSELQRLFSSASKESERLASLLANDGTQWRFNPPSAPHFGGKWESGVKSVKTHLKRTIGDQLLTYEEISTLLTQIEAILNSRPLCPLSDDADDLSALTPGHFSIGHAPALIPESQLDMIKVSHLNRWQLIRQMLESFWTRWSSEYLQRFHAMYKWQKSTPSLREGTLVLVVDERYPSSKWPLGRILHTHPGKDGHTRVVTIRTQTSILKRPIVKVCPLPISTNSM